LVKSTVYENFFQSDPLSIEIYQYFYCFNFLSHTNIHSPVLLSEVLNALKLRVDGIYVDGTFGRGGHSQALLAQLNENGRILAFDRDPEAVKIGQILAAKDKRFKIIHSTFSELKHHCAAHHLIRRIDGLLLDLGVSSPQLENAERGFSFLREGPLDMRMNPEQGLTLEKWLSTASVTEITEILKTYGEERHARRIAQAIFHHRLTVKNTKQLADIVAAAHPAWEKGKHPATKTFQALRIFINRELQELETVLPQAVEMLAPAGRLVMISFHSLEDRMVKRFIRNQARGVDFPDNLPIKACDIHSPLRAIGKPIRPSAEEILRNPRARSAILRVAERCD